ncbi:hypothetical protein [Gemmatimonas sp.]
MRRTWQNWSGLVLTLVWMAARLVLPLHPTCPHHGAAAGLAGISANASSHAHHTAHQAAPQLAGQVAASSDAVPEPQQDASCNCTTDCCAASVVVVGTASDVSFDEIIGLRNQRSAGEPRGIGHAARVAHRQPPATAPPARSDFV